MICYKDREYCGREDCRWYKRRPGCGKDWKQCEDSFDYAMQEKERSERREIRELPVSFSIWADCPNFEKKEQRK